MAVDEETRRRRQAKRIRLGDVCPNNPVADAVFEASGKRHGIEASCFCELIDAFTSQFILLGV